jgi:inorganic pyrophosphatase
VGDPAYEDVHDLADLPRHVVREIGQFFAVYKELGEGNPVSDEGQEGRDAALRVLAEARARA